MRLFNSSKPTRDFVPLDLHETIAEPQESEVSIHDISLCVLGYCKINLLRLKNYKGSSQKIRMAISNPSANVETEAWSAVKPTIFFLRDSYITAVMISELVVCILRKLAVPDIKLGVSNYHALVHILCDFMTYIYEFDDMKVNNPEIQNDFSFYRRTFSRTRSGPSRIEHQLISEDLANLMSLFFAVPNPMFSYVCTHLSQNQVPEYASEATRIRTAIINSLMHEANYSRDSKPWDEFKVLNQDEFNLPPFNALLEDLQRMEEEAGFIEVKDMEPLFGVLIESLTRYIEENYNNIESTKDEAQMYMSRFLRISLVEFVLFYDHLIEGGVVSKKAGKHLDIKTILKLVKEDTWDVQNYDRPRVISLFKFSSKYLGTADASKGTQKLLNN